MSAQPQIRGRIAGIAAALCYGVVTSFSKLAYDGGANPATVMFFRFLVAAVLLALIVAIVGKSWRLRIPMKKFALMAVAWFAISMGHLGSVKFIPVSLAAIIFYTFPLLIVAYKRLVDRSPVSIAEIVTFVLAFAGLYIALGPSFAESDWRGIALVSGAAICAAAFVIMYEHASSETDEITVAFWLSFGASFIGLIVMTGMSSMSLPMTGTAIFGLSALSLFGLVAFVLSLFAIRLAGATTTAMLLNLEPVVIFVAAAIVVGEEITVTRAAGLTLVLAALIISQWRALGGKASG